MQNPFGTADAPSRVRHPPSYTQPTTELVDGIFSCTVPAELPTPSGLVVDPATDLHVDDVARPDRHRCRRARAARRADPRRSCTEVR